MRAYNDITIAAVRDRGMPPPDGRQNRGSAWVAASKSRSPAISGSPAPIRLRSAGEEHGDQPRPCLADTLVNAIGRTAALELVLEGRFMDAEEALRRGLITRITEEGGLDAEISATVERICAGAPLAHRFNGAIRRVRMQGDESEEQYARAAFYGDTEDYRNAWTSFMKKVEFKAAESYRCYKARTSSVSVEITETLYRRSGIKASSDTRDGLRIQISSTRFRTDAMYTGSCCAADHACPFCDSPAIWRARRRPKPGKPAQGRTGSDAIAKRSGQGIEIDSIKAATSSSLSAAGSASHMVEV